MVSIEQTSKKYRGRKAETYDGIRRKQERWDLENEAVERYLRELKPRNVLDCPVGTGRFLRTYLSIGVRRVRGVDISEEMLALARKKVVSRKWVSEGCTLTLEIGDAADLPDDRWDTVVCVRFLDLIDEDAMRRVMRELARVASRAVVLTIRLGEAYVPKSNTATHDRRKFYRLVRSLGLEVAHATPIFRQGWEVMMLRRKDS